MDLLACIIYLESVLVLDATFQRKLNMADSYDEDIAFSHLDESSETLHNLRMQVSDQCIPIVVASADSLFRDGLVALIDQWDEFCLLAAAESMEEASELCINSQGCVCMIDATINCQSLETIKSIREKAPLVKIIILSTSGSNDDVIEALRAGIHGYCIREAIAADRIRGMIWGILSGAVMIFGLKRATLNRHSDENMVAHAYADAFEALSKREKEVLMLLAQGLSNAEIGGRLFLSEATIKKNISRIITKLQVENRIQAAVLGSRYMNQNTVG